MSNKTTFIAEIGDAIERGTITLSPAAAQYYDELKQNVKSNPIITEKGIAILSYMQDNETKYNNIFKSKDIAEALFCSARQVSGAMQKLIKEGFCEKLGGSPVCYKITELGKNQKLNEEEEST